MIPMLENISAQPASHRALLALHAGNQHATLRSSAELIRKTQGRVIFTGMGGSLFATLAAVSRLAEQGYPAQALESAELLHYGSASLRAADLRLFHSQVNALHDLHLSKKRPSLNIQPSHHISAPTTAAQTADSHAASAPAARRIDQRRPRRIDEAEGGGQGRAPLSLSQLAAAVNV